jgi:hypothetical protein
MAMLVVAAVSAAIEVGSMIYRLLNRPKARPPVADLQISSSTDGAPIPFGYGRGRIAGSLIWTPGLFFTEAGISGTGSLFTPDQKQFLFFANCAFLFCEGPATILRMWGDSKLIYESTPGVSEYPASNFPAWSNIILYNIGDIVGYLGVVYTCEQENKGIHPGQPASDTGGILYWQALGSYAPWNTDGTYNPGDVVIDGGILYVNIQSTSAPAHTTSNTHYWQLLDSYYGNFAFYPGTEEQLPDPLIQADKGVANTPAFRGTCYVRIENFRLANFGNRIPNLRAEIAFGTASGPVIVQQGIVQNLEPSDPQIGLGLPILGNDYLIAIARWREGTFSAVPEIDDDVNDWTPLYAEDNKGIWYCANPVPSIPGTPLEINFRYTDIGFSFNADAYVIQVRGQTAFATAVANGTAGPIAVSLGDVSISIGDLGSNTHDWVAALFTFTDNNGGRLTIAVLMADAGFAVAPADALPGYQYVFPSGLPSWSTVMSLGLPTNRLGQVVLDVCERSGLKSDQVDVSLLTAETVFPSDIVQGYVITRAEAAAEIIKVLFQAYFFDGCETDGVLRFVPRGLPPAITIPEDELGLLEDGAKVKPEQLSQSQDLPIKVTVLYNDVSMDYQQGKQEKQRSARIITTKQQDTIELPISTDASFARQVAEKTLFLAWLERSSYSINLWRALYMLLDPTDVIQFVYQGATFQMRAVDTLLGQGFVVAINGVGDNAGNYLSSAAGAAGSGFKPQPLRTNAPTLLFLFDVPLLIDQSANPGGTGYYFAMTSALVDWPGAELFRSSDDAAFDFVDDSATAAKFGYATNALGPPRSPWTWDNVNTLNVKMTFGTPAGSTDLNVLNGGNLFLVGSPARGWELIQPVNVVLEMDGTYTLSRLLRGRRGTEVICGSHAAGDLVVVLPAGVRHENDSLSLINKLRYYKGVTTGQDESLVVSQQFTNTGNDLRPYAPVHIVGARDVDANLTITWIRRTRIGGEWIDNTGTVPLSESSELYDVEILNGSTVIRTFTDLATPTVEYSGVQQGIDFGSVQDSVSVNVFQKSGLIGRGFKASATV